MPTPQNRQTHSKNLSVGRKISWVLHFSMKMSLYAAYNCTDSGKINSGKNFFHFYEKLAQQKSTDSYQSKRGHPSEEIFLCSEYFEWACFGKNWAIQAQVLYTSSPKKIRLIDGHSFPGNACNRPCTSANWFRWVKNCTWR